MVEGVQKQINQISPVIGVLDFLTGRWDERLVDFSIQIARDGAWDFALAYANTSKERKHELLLRRDHSTAWLGKDLAHPRFPLNLIASFVKVFERKNIQAIAQVLFQ